MKSNRIRYYTAPEMVRGRRYGKRADVWSLGVVLCTLLTGRLPFAGKNHADEEGLKRSILRGSINFEAPVWKEVSALAKDLVRSMLQVRGGGRGRRGGEEGVTPNTYLRPKAVRMANSSYYLTCLPCVCMHVCVCARARARVRSRACDCVHACMHAWMRVCVCVCLVCVSVCASPSSPPPSG